MSFTLVTQALSNATYGSCPPVSDTHALGPVVRRWSTFAELSPADRQAVLDLPVTRRRYGRDAYIVREGQPSIECCVIISGMAFRQKLVRDGSRQIISFHIASEFVDLQNGLLDVADHNVQSLQNCEIGAVPRSAIMALAEERPAVRHAMWVDTLIDASIFREWVVNVGRRDSRARIAHLICELYFRMEKVGLCNDGGVDFPITQEQLADAIGLTSVHTNRTLQGLRREGLIELTARTLRILDREALCRAGDFDETYLHHTV